MERSKKHPFVFAIITLLFFFLGFITVLVDSLIPRLRELFELTYFQAGMVQFAFFSAYFSMSIPSSYVILKIGYKGGIVSGLLIMVLGCMLFYPAADMRSFLVFIFGYFTIASGMTLLQVAINPFIAALGDEKTSSSRLTLAQAFNSLGTAIAPIIGAYFILSDTIKSSDEIEKLSASSKEIYLATESAAVQTPFVLIAFVIAVVAVLLTFLKLPKIVDLSHPQNYFKVFKHRNLMLGVLGIFCYVGAEVAIGSYLVNYFLEMNLVPQIKANGLMSFIAQKILGSDLSLKDGKAIVGVFVTFYWSGAMVGRFIGAYLTRYFSPGKVVFVFGSSAIIMAIISMGSVGLVSMWSIISIGFFNSIMFPTIFTLALKGLGDLKPQASGLLCMAIVGGAIVPPLFGFVADLSGFKIAILVVIICYFYIAYFGLKNAKNEVLVK